MIWVFFPNFEIDHNKKIYRRIKRKKWKKLNCDGTDRTRRIERLARNVPMSLQFSLYKIYFLRRRRCRAWTCLIHKRLTAPERRPPSVSSQNFQKIRTRQTHRDSLTRWWEGNPFRKFSPWFDTNFSGNQLNLRAFNKDFLLTIVTKNSHPDTYSGKSTNLWLPKKCSNDKPEITLFIEI